MRQYSLCGASNPIHTTFSVYSVMLSVRAMGLRPVPSCVDMRMGQWCQTVPTVQRERIGHPLPDGVRAGLVSSTPAWTHLTPHVILLSESDCVMYNIYAISVVIVADVSDSHAPFISL